MTEIVRKIKQNLDEKGIGASVKSLFKKKKAKIKNANGTKRKGRLPAKVIINKLGNSQTVYYRPDEHSKSEYINPAKQDVTQTLLQYGDSLKNMMFKDHDSGTNQNRSKGQENQSWGNAMTSKLDKLADKYGFDRKNFDQKYKTMIKTKHKNVDKLLADAEKIYGDLYKHKGGKSPKDFVNHIFMPTKNRIHSKKAGESLINGIQNISSKSVMEKNTPYKKGDQWKGGNSNKSAPSSSKHKKSKGGSMKMGSSLINKAKNMFKASKAQAKSVAKAPKAPTANNPTGANDGNEDDDNKSLGKKILEGAESIYKTTKQLLSQYDF